MGINTLSEKLFGHSCFFEKQNQEKKVTFVFLFAVTFTKK